MPDKKNNKVPIVPKEQMAVEKISFPRSEMAQEIISRNPDFWERWALGLFLGVLLLLVAGTWFIQYPDIIQANAKLIANNAPKEIITRQEGKLIKLFIHNGDSIEQGEPIAWIESTTNHEEAMKLSALVDQCVVLLSHNDHDKIATVLKKEFYQLGELQSPYQQFMTALQQFNDYFVNGYYFKRKAMLLQDMSYLKLLHGVALNQKALKHHDIKLAEEVFNTNNLLFKDKVISRQDLRNERSKLIGKQLSIPQLTSSLLTNENQQISKRKEIYEIEHDIAQQKLLFSQALQTLKSHIDEWMKKYVILAPVSGKVAFLTPLQENIFLQSQKTLGFVNPPNSYYYAQLYLTQDNFGKIDTGQKVQLRFEAYPYQEFGSIEASLDYVSTIPSDSGFLATAHFTNGLITNYNTPLQYKSGLKAEAIIITANMRLLERIYYNIVKATSVNKK
jgi:HlyD family secretion protein